MSIDLTKRSKPATIWLGIIPGIFGYGISVAETSKAKAMTALRKAYDEYKEANPNPNTDFETSFEYWGGSVSKIELGRSYFDGFKS
jgi:hypothetical protein